MSETATVPETALTEKAKKVSPGKVIIVDSEAEKAVELVQQYLDDSKIGDFSAVPFYHKLAVLQRTPDRFVLTRTIGGNQIPYVAHQYAEKALNFAFNFRVSSELLDSKLETKTQKVSVRQPDGSFEKEDRVIHIGAVHVKFTFTLPDGGTIVRTVVSSHKAFENPATTPDDALKSAVSKSWTVVARSFGIGTDVNEPDEDVSDVPASPGKRSAPASEGGGTCAECGKATDAAWKKQCVPCWKKANPRT